MKARGRGLEEEEEEENAAQDGLHAVPRFPSLAFYLSAGLNSQLSPSHPFLAHVTPDEYTTGDYARDIHTLRAASGAVHAVRDFACLVERVGSPRR